MTPQERLRQVLATQARPLWTLPSSWWDEDVAVRMADWVKRNKPRRRVSS